MVTRIGPRVSLIDQINARKLGPMKNAPYRDRPLAFEMTTPRGNLMRAADVFGGRDAAYESDTLRIAALGARVDNYYALMREGKVPRTPKIEDLGTVVELVRTSDGFLCHSALIVDPQRTHRWAKDLLTVCDAYTRDQKVNTEPQEVTDEANWQSVTAEVLSHEFGFPEGQTLMPGGLIVYGSIKLFQGIDGVDQQPATRFISAPSSRAVREALSTVAKTEVPLAHLFWFNPRYDYGND